MGKFNELLAARYNECVSAVLGLAEQEGVRTVAPELMPIFVLEGERIEHSYLKYEKKAFAGINAPPVAAQFGLIAFLNPVGSNQIMTVEQVSVGMAAAGQVRVGILFPRGTVLANNAGNAGSRDTRWLDPANINGKCSGQIFFDSTAAPSFYAGAPTYRVPAGQMLAIPGEIVLMPGYSVMVQHTTVNLGFEAAFTWRERAALPEENAP